jgi:parallel beta-helix repeat protein
MSESQLDVLEDISETFTGVNAGVGGTQLARRNTLDVLKDIRAGILAGGTGGGGTGDSSYTAVGTGAVARTVQLRLGDEPVSVADYQTAVATSDQAAFFAAINTGHPVMVPYRSTPYLLTDFINLLSNTVIFGEGRPTIKATVGGRIFRLNALTGVSLKGLVFDGNKGNVTAASVLLLQNATNCLIEDCDFLNDSGSLFVSATSTSNRFVRCRFLDGAGTALDLTGSGCAHNSVLDCEFQRNTGFGVRMSSGANRNLVQGCRTISNGIELVGLTYQTWGNRIIGNHAEGCGDNGISISGYQNTVVGNTCRGNKYTGLYLYGRENTATGNSCINNGQAHNPAFLYYDAANVTNYAGLTLGGGWGAVAHNNAVAGNFCDDDQSTPTQFYGIRLNSAAYNAWVTATVYATGVFVRSGSHIYLASVGGTSGATAPTHTSGSTSDGGVTWEYAGPLAGGTAEAYGNVVSGNRVYRFASGGVAVSDGTQNHSNSIIDADHLEFFGAGGMNTVTGGFTRRPIVWSSGAVVVFGDIRYASSNNVVYRCANVGGTAANAPSHISGTVTGGDGIAWLAYSDSQRTNQLLINAGDVRVNTVFQIPQLDSNSAFTPLFSGSGSPEGKVTAGVAAVYLRADGAAATTMYVKESGTGATGWAAVGGGGGAAAVSQSTLAYAATLNTNAATNVNWAVGALTGATTLANPTNLVAGMTLNWRLLQNATGGWTVAFGTMFKFPYGITPAMPAGANAKALVTAYYDGTDLIANLSPDHR